MGEPNLHALMRSTGEIHSDVKHLVKQMDDLQARLEKTQERLTVVEQFRWKIIGMTLIVPTALSGFGLWLRSSV